MKKLGITVAVLVMIVVGIITCWNIAYPSGTWRYKMTVTVDTPEGLKSGYAVREVHISQSPRLTPETHASMGVKGEAVTVDLGKRGTLFALLRGEKMGVDYGYYIVFDAFPYEKGGATREGLKYYSHLKAGPKELTPDLYPTLVAFKDINDPKSVSLALEMTRKEIPNTPMLGYPVVIKKDNFEELFGKGVKLHSITIEMTDEKVTWGIEKLLPWLPEYYNKAFDGSTIMESNDLPSILGTGSFKEEN